MNLKLLSNLSTLRTNVRITQTHFIQNMLCDMSSVQDFVLTEFCH